MRCPIPVGRWTCLLPDMNSEADRYFFGGRWAPASAGLGSADRWLTFFLQTFDFDLFLSFTLFHTFITNRVKIPKKIYNMQ